MQKVEDYAGFAVQIINDNVPYFDEEDKKNRASHKTPNYLLSFADNNDDFANEATF